MHLQSCILSGLAAVAVLANPQPNPNPEPQITATAIPSPAQSAAIESELGNLEFNIGLFDMSELNRATAALATAPVALQTAIAAALPQNAQGNFPAFVSAVNEVITGTPSGFGALPTDVQAFVKSIGNEAASIINNGGSSAAATSTGGAAKMNVQWAAGMLGAGVIGAAVL